MTTISGGALTQQLYGKLFDRLDVDASLGLTQDELKAAASSRSDEAFTAAFEKLDADKDGKISLDELKTAFETMRQRRMRQGDGPPPGPPPEGPPQGN